MIDVISALVGVALLVKGKIKLGKKQELAALAVRVVGIIALLPLALSSFFQYSSLAASEEIKTYLDYVSFGAVIVAVLLVLLLFRQESPASAPPPVVPTASISPDQPVVVIQSGRPLLSVIITALAAIAIVAIISFYLFPSTFDSLLGKLSKLFLPKLPDELTEKADIPQEFKLPAVIPAVVSLECYLGESGAGGSGVSGYAKNGRHIIMTNAHVVKSEDGQLADYCVIFFPYSDGTLFESAYISKDISSFDEVEAVLGGELASGLDYALLEISEPVQKPDGTFYPRLRAYPDVFRIAGKSCKKDRTIEIGEKLFVIGYPAVGGFNITVTEGIVSGFEGPYIKTSAKIEQGNSGGLAILEKDGCLLGIPTLAVSGYIESIGGILPYHAINEFLEASSPENRALYELFLSN